jgi:hypothetical protein
MSIYRYPPEVGEVIAELMETHCNREIAEALNGRFPELPKFTALKVNCYKRNHGLKSSRRVLPKGRSKFPEGLLDFVTENVKGRCTSELAQMVRERFGIDFTVQQARTYIRNHGLASGYDTRFKKGHASFNKGLKQTEFMSPEQIENSKRTRFQTGHMPHNHLDVGTVVVTTDGYLARKIAEPNQWEMVHRRVWENHNGPIPKGYCIIFLDGNPLNCDISNLQMVSLAENCRMNQSHMRFSDPELTKTGIMVAKLSNAAGKKKRSLKND